MKPLSAQLMPIAILLVFLLLAAPPQAYAQEAQDEPASEAIPIDDLRTFVEAFHQIQREYVNELEDQELLESAMRGLLEGLDPHSSYLAPMEYQRLQDDTAGEYGGLGIQVQIEEGFIRVIAPIDDTPAYRAGIKSGDQIVRLDDTPVSGLSDEEAMDKMRGVPGSSIRLTVRRPGEAELLTFNVVRDIIRSVSVRHRLLEPGYGYVRISQFEGATGNHLRDAVVKMQEEGELKGLVLDLRDNPGGVLNAAIEVSDTFLDGGEIVSTRGRARGTDFAHRAEPPDFLNGAPLVVLVNEGSASASEIVAGALQDQGRAVIMGQKTFGKGSVQTIVPLNNRGALKLTTAHYYTPSGRSIQEVGIEPDIQISNLELAEAEDDGIAAVTEADLERHLENPNEDAESSDEQQPADNAAEERVREILEELTDEQPAPDTNTAPQSLARTDYALYEALNLLKGMALIQNRQRAAR